MAGGKGGKQTTSVTVPEWLETAAKGNLARADELAKIGYTPYYGPDVAAMTPAQIAAMQGTNAAAQAFGLGGFDPMAGMPQAQNFSGMQAYSSGGLYDQALADLEARAPGQFAALRAPFINPVTGAAPASPFGSTPLVAPAPAPAGVAAGSTPPGPYGEGYAGFDIGATPGTGGFGGFGGLGNAVNDASVALGGSGFGAGASGFWGDSNSPSGGPSGMGGGK